MQLHRFDIAHRETATVLARVRALCERNPAIIAMGEVGRSMGDAGSLVRAANYISGGQGLHAAYSLHVMMLDGSADSLRAAVADVERLFEAAGFIWSFSNHDVSRVASRWGAGDPAAARLYLALLLTLRGAACLYQGEELGLPEAELPFDALRDPYGLQHWPAIRGRDGCRTPMPWRSDAGNAGFSTASKTWLPFCEPHRPLAVDRQDREPCSHLSLCRELLRLRRQHPALRDGALVLRDARAPILAFERQGGGERVCCLFNMGADPVSAGVPGVPQGLIFSSGADIVVENERVHLPPYGVYVASIRGDST
jgi:alpha-glucosidase